MGIKSVELFAGFGGSTLGAKHAGVETLWAANHWPLACNMLSWNHPETKVVCQDLRQANWAALPNYDLLIASPACQGFSEASQPARAKDSKFHDADRQTPWAVVDCVEITTPKAFAIENVKQFREWKLYDLWKQALTMLGYHLTEQLIDATHCGVPQRRERLWIVGSRRKLIHVHVPAQKEPPIGPCIDWDEGEWHPISRTRSRFPNAYARLTAASKRFKRSLVQHVTGHKGISPDEAIRTVTTKAQWVAVQNRKYRYLNPREIARAQGFPDSCWFDPTVNAADNIKGFGNAVPPPMAKRVVEQVVAEM